MKSQRRPENVSTTEQEDGLIVSDRRLGDIWRKTHEQEVGDWVEVPLEV